MTKPLVEQFLLNLRDLCKRLTVAPAIASIGCLQFAALIARKPPVGKSLSWWAWMRMASRAFREAK